MAKGEPEKAKVTERHRFASPVPRLPEEIQSLGQVGGGVHCPSGPAAQETAFVEDFGGIAPGEQGKGLVQFVEGALDGAFAVAKSVGGQDSAEFSAIFIDIGGGTTDIA
ncbi:MAG TPA: hypothetical protein VLV54_06795, partial [Thermoanaerobaculia bacterium]|nr:hypothetical protein [Thermoanaerobaculia bacterium]